MNKQEYDRLVAEVAEKIHVSELPPLHCHLQQQHFTEPVPIACKWCGSKDTMKYGIRDGVQEYICKACRRKFTNRDNPFGKRSTVEQIGTSISSYYDGLSFADVARHLKESGNEVNESTACRSSGLKITVQNVD